MQAYTTTTILFYALSYPLSIEKEGKVWVL